MRVIAEEEAQGDTEPEHEDYLGDMLGSKFVIDVQVRTAKFLLSKSSFIHTTE